MWKLDTGERLSCWRSFRKNLDQLSLEEAIDATATFWRDCPFHPYYLDADKPESWPGPWELIEENYYCDLAKALGMLYTIYFTKHGAELESEIRVYYDPVSKYVYNLAIFGQGKYVVNFIDNEIVNIESIDKLLKLKHSYSSKDLKLELY
jgi:hypothetical protein